MGSTSMRSPAPCPSTASSNRFDLTVERFGNYDSVLAQSTEIECAAYDALVVAGCARPMRLRKRSGIQEVLVKLKDH
jgi:hypothetical protein